MSNKRSPSPAAAEDGAPPASKPKTDHGDAPAPADGDMDPLPTTSAHPEDDAPAAAPERASEEAAETTVASGGEDKPQEVAEKRRDGIKVDSLKTIREMYEDGALQGYDDKDDVVYDYDATLNDKVVIWCGSSLASPRFRPLTSPLRCRAGEATLPCAALIRIGPSSSIDLCARRPSKSTASSMRRTSLCSAAVEVRRLSRPPHLALLG